MAITLNRSSRWTQTRGLAGGGAPVAEAPAGDLNDQTVYPPNDPGVIECGSWENILLYWTGTGEARASQTITFEPLFWDGINSRWVAGATFSLPPRTVGVLEVYQAAKIWFRVSGVVGVAGVTNATLWTAGGLPARSIL